MSCTCTHPGSPDDDGVFSCSFTGPSRSGDDFGERLSLYMSAPEQFVPRSETELNDMTEIAAVMMAEVEAAEQEEREQREAEEEEALMGAAYHYDPADWPWSWEL